MFLFGPILGRKWDAGIFESITYVFVWPYLGKKISLGVPGVFGVTYVFVWPYLGIPGVFGSVTYVFVWPYLGFLGQ